MTKPILVVDDSQTTRLGLEHFLQQLGHDVIPTASAEEALKLVDRGLEPKMAIVDYNLPGDNGVTLIRGLRSRTSCRFIPIVVMSTEFRETLRAEARSAGATGWLVKPATVPRLSELLATLLPHDGN